MNEPARIPFPPPKVPEVCVTQGKVGIFIGPGYRLLPIETARQYRARLDECIRQIERGEAKR